ncbi:GNAT family N-acetyltransferase [Streptococcus cuniculipharyngis]
MKLAEFSLIETKDLLLRPFLFNDRQEFLEISTAAEPLPFIFPQGLTVLESDYVFVHDFLKNPLGIWAIEEKKTGTLLGAIRLENLSWADKKADLAYFIRRESWGQGYATQVVKTISFLSFQEFGLAELNIVTHLENLASQRVAQKAGFQELGQFKGSDRHSRKTRRYKAFVLRRRDYSDE